ncbi:Cytochrome P450 monooxygenase adrA [Paramyrothecium foliicola]|nr:Cytochrome P450 monooxygenase adrA [Paramyrothecium foliicola]
MSNGTLYMPKLAYFGAEDSGTTTIQTLILVTILAIAARLTHSIVYGKSPESELPLINGRKPWAFSVKAEEVNFKQNAKALIEYGFKTAGKAFRLQTDNGVHVVLSAEYADSIRNHPNLSLPELTAGDFHSGIPGFDAWTVAIIIALLYQPLTEKINEDLDISWKKSTAWREISLPETALFIVSRGSSRVLLGPELCDNPNWVPYILSYIENTHKASYDLRQWPRLLRPFAHQFLASCRDLRADFEKCAGLVMPVLEQRRREKQARIAKGLQPEEYLDAMEWLEQLTNGQPYNPTAAHMTFAIAGIFSSTDTLTQVIYDLCDQPKLVEDLRKEVISIRTGSQWDKKSLSQLKLMDSVMKETQRLKPIAIASMHRLAVGDIILPDGVRIPKGTRLMVSAHQSWDESIYPNADQFDGYRFLKLREEGSPTAQFATTSASTIGFGHGHWACPARVFASDEIKIALSHILLKYDFKLAPGAKIQTKRYGFVSQADTTGRIMVRRRKEEIQL